ncbi:GNAT family N-acetyltransferase [Isoptericola sp. NEAU-Y5]|uniref:GNAT family N-acetyltransferase n=1 Tax=Isoptericola luteus TaxID=2879484 RepID=A0ABS7ZEM7_9MICO|nr:GNAT family N-acetyltransferase [Isoptericola sp. NEAU-Y5]MCA5893506.1 GNAT family N-acetyltransferase [Isoptericola sp. NEAU-Y5]
MRILPATADRFDDVVTLLNPRGREEACWCLHWRLPPPGVERQDHLRGLAAGEPAPGLLAYLGPEDETAPGGRAVDRPAGEVVGWLGLSPRSQSRTLQRSRVLPAGDPESWPTTWVVMCFTVRPGHRRRGVARALLHGGVEYARSHGARTIEGYPVDPGFGRVPVGSAFVGTVGLFEGAGFTRVGPTSATSGRLPRWVMRLELEES